MCPLVTARAQAITRLLTSTIEIRDAFRHSIGTDCLARGWVQEGEERVRTLEGAVHKVDRLQDRRRRPRPMLPTAVRLAQHRLQRPRRRSRPPPPTAGRRAQHPLRRLPQRVTYHNLRDAVGCGPTIEFRAAIRQC